MRSLANAIPKHFYLVAISAVAVLRGCSCSGDPSGRDSWDCLAEGRKPAPTEVCDDSERFVKGECAPSRCDAGEPQCCPGLTCAADGNCVLPARVRSCTTDTECPTGLSCIDRPWITTANKTCGFVPIDGNGGCAPGSRPFNERCITSVPCNGQCAAGRVCNIDTNSCEDRPAGGAGDGCDQACAPGQLLVYAHPNAMLFDQCCEVYCECQPLPDLDPGSVGRYASLALDFNSVYVSAYDATFGDLVLMTYARDTLAFTKLEFIDGAPSTGTLAGNPAGPRAGIGDPGPDVGQYTSMAMQRDGAPRIAYYDADNGDLKYAAFDPDNQTWTVSLIDDGRDSSPNKADVGRYASLRIDARGVPHVTYYADRIAPNGTVVTGPVYARGKSIAPASYDDWDRVMVEAVSGCGACDLGQTCVLDEGVPACKAPATTCTPACGCGERCVTATSGVACREELPMDLRAPCPDGCGADSVCVRDATAGSVCAATSTACTYCPDEAVCVDDGAGGGTCRAAAVPESQPDLAKGVGLFTSLAIGPSETPLVVYYDSLRKQLRGAVPNFSQGASIASGFTAFPVVCVQGEDIGRHASLAVTPTGVAVAYQGQAGQNLWLCQGDSLLTCSGDRQLADDGVRGVGEAHMVGAYASLATTAGGDPYIAYADQTANNLVLAFKDHEDWRHEDLESSGMAGAFAQLRIAGSMGYAVTLVRSSLGALDTSHVVVTKKALGVR